MPGPWETAMSTLLGQQVWGIHEASMLKHGRFPPMPDPWPQDKHQKKSSKGMESLSRVLTDYLVSGPSLQAPIIHWFCCLLNPERLNYKSVKLLWSVKSQHWGREHFQYLLSSTCTTPHTLTPLGIHKKPKTAGEETLGPSDYSWTVYMFS